MALQGPLRGINRLHSCSTVTMDLIRKLLVHVVRDAFYCVRFGFRCPKHLHCILHLDSNKYKGSPPRGLSKAPTKASANMAACLTACEGAALVHPPDVPACVVQPEGGKIPWL